MEESDDNTEETTFILVENETNSIANYVRRHWMKVSSAFHFSRQLQEVRKNRLLDAVKQNDLKEIKIIAKTSPELMETYKNGGKNILQIACSDLAQFVEPKTVENLISLGADLFYTTEECGGWNCLHFAAQSHKKDLLKLVAEVMTERNKKYINTTTDEGDTALLILIKSIENFDENTKNCCKVLLDLGSDVDKPNLEGLTPILQAHFSNCFDQVLKIFLDHEKVVLDLDSSKYEGKSARDLISQHYSRQLPLKIGEYLFKLLVGNEEAFSKLSNLEKYSNLTQRDESLIEIARRLELWKACRTLIYNAVKLPDPDFAIEVTSKCGLFKEVQKVSSEEPCENLNLLMDLCVFVFQFFRENEDDSVNYRLCFKELIDRILIVNNNKIPEFSDCPGIYLYIANMDLPLKKNYLDELVREREDLNKLNICCDSYICEDQDENTITFHYRNFLPINNSRNVFTYLANHDILKKILLHPLFRAFFNARVEPRYYLLPHASYIIVYAAYFFTIIISRQELLFVSLGFFLFCLITTIFRSFFELWISAILAIPSSILSTIALSTLCETKIFPLVILFLGFIQHLTASPSYGMMVYKVILMRISFRYLKFFSYIGILFINVAIVLHLLFKKDPSEYSQFQKPCQEYYCSNSSNLDISNGACVLTILNQNETTCEEYYNKTATFIEEFGKSCESSNSESPYSELCNHFYLDVIEKGFTKHLECFDNYFCRKFIFENRLTIPSLFQPKCVEGIAKTDSDLEAINKVCQEHSLQSTFDRFRNFCTPLFCNNENQSSGLPALFRTLVIAIGEIDASSLDLNTNPYSGFIIAIIILTIHVILMNVLTGLLLCDIQDIRGEARLQWYIIQANRFGKLRIDLSIPSMNVDKETGAIENMAKSRFYFRCMRWMYEIRIPRRLAKSIHIEVLNLLAKKKRASKIQGKDNSEAKLDQMMKVIAKLCERFDKFENKQVLD